MCLTSKSICGVERISAESCDRSAFGRKPENVGSRRDRVGNDVTVAISVSERDLQ